MEWTDEVRLETPEQVDMDLELAGLGSRFVAQLLDWLIKGLISLGVVLLILVVSALLGHVLDFDRISPLLGALALAFLYLLWLGFDILFEMRYNGQTPGKKVAGIRVIREGGAPLDFQAAAVRNLLGMADLLPCFYILGAILIQLGPRRQRLGDMAAGTLVIRERGVEIPEDQLKVIGELASPEVVFTAQQLDACSAEDRHILRSFFQRFDQLEEAGRDRLIQNLATTLMQKTAYQSPSPFRSTLQDTVFLASLYRDLEDKARRRY